MKHWLASLAVLSLLAAPAAAQQTGSDSGKGTSTQTGGQAANQNKAQLSAMSQEKLKDSLNQAGFREIQIVDAAYVVHARTKDGDRVVMYIDPPSSTTAASGSASGTSATQSMDKQKK